jgi:hypothetical protein
MLFLKNNEYKFLNLYKLSLIFLFFDCMYKDEPMEEINEVAPMEGMTGDATVEVNGAAAVNVVNGAGVNCKFSHAYLPELSFVYVCLMIYLSVLLICVLSSVHMLICLYGLSSVHIFISSMCIFNTFLPFKITRMNHVRLICLFVLISSVLILSIHMYLKLVRFCCFGKVNKYMHQYLHTFPLKICNS